MAKIKHRADATEQVEAYIAGMPAWSKAICQRLRGLILKSDPGVIEDWKWGPNYYYKDSMLCGYAAFRKHVNFVFFRGVQMKDKKKLFAPESAGNANTRHIRYKDVKELDEETILTYLFEALEIRESGKPPPAKDKTVTVPADVKKAFKLAGVLAYFDHLAYSHRKAWMQWIGSAKRKETRLSRIDRAIQKLKDKQIAPY